MYRTANMVEGDEVTIGELGPVRITKIYPAGAIKVRDLEDRLWLLTADYFKDHAQVSLWQFSEN